MGYKIIFLCSHEVFEIEMFKALNLLKSIANTEWGADCTTLLKLYRSLIRSKLDYGCIVYGSARQSYIQTLDPIHNQAIRLCLGAFRTSPMESLYVESHEPSLYDRRKELALQYILKLKANPTNPAYNAVFHPNYLLKFRDRPHAIAPFGIRMKHHVREIGLKLNAIAINTVPETPIWDAPEVNVLLDLTTFNKATTSSDLFKSKFLELKAKYSHFCPIYTDGSKQGERVQLPWYLHMALHHFDSQIVLVFFQLRSKLYYVPYIMFSVHTLENSFLVPRD